MVQPILMEKIEHVTNIFGAAAIAQWICLHLPSCSPGSNPKHTICAFNNELCYKKTTKMNNKQINRIKKYCWQVCYTNAVNGSTCLCSRELCNSSNRNFSPEIVCGICFVQFVVSAIYRTINSTWYHACLDHLLIGAKNTKFREPSPLAEVSLYRWSPFFQVWIQYLDYIIKIINFLIWSYHFLLNRRPIFQWSFPQQWVFSAQLLC